MDRYKEVLEDDQKEKVLPLIWHRLPWLVVGLVGGIIATIFASYFENLLIKHIELTYFIPVIVYMSAAVGSQTATIYVRNLARERVKFWVYFFKELILGACLGVTFGFLLGMFAYFWFRSIEVALAVSLAMAVSILTSPIVSLIIPSILKKEHTDPAVGAGPFTTVVQDLISLIIYFIVSTIVVFGGVTVF